MNEFEGQSSNRDNQGLRGEIKHAPEKIVEEQFDPSFSEKIIMGSDRGSQEELVSSLHMMLNKINFPVSALEEELENDEKKINTLNMLANKYVEAVKTLNTEEQKEAVEALKQLLG